MAVSYKKLNKDDAILLLVDHLRKLMPLHRILLYSSFIYTTALC